jgi:hypothetical protein
LLLLAGKQRRAGQRHNRQVAIAGAGFDWRGSQTAADTLKLLARQKRPAWQRAEVLVAAVLVVVVIGLVISTDRNAS